VSIAEFTPSMMLAILPEITLLVLAGLLLLVDAVWRKSGQRSLGWLTAAGLTVILVLTFIFSRPDASQGLIFGGMLRHDWPA